MLTQEYDIQLESEQHFHGRLPTHHLGFFFADLPKLVRGSVSMAFRRRSKKTGKQPNWIANASDVRFVGHSGNGLTHLVFECPTLESSAPEVYRQKELFDTGRPNGSLTGLDLLMNVINDVDNRVADSESFDPDLLRSIAGLTRFFRFGPFNSLTIGGVRDSVAEKVKITPSTIENSNQLYGRTPTPQRCRIVGTLDGIEASTQRFSILLDSNERVTGVYPDSIADGLQALWRKRVLVLGTSVFRASGNLLRIEAETIVDGANASPVFSKPPVASRGRLDSSRFRKSQGKRTGMAAIMDRWPGDETEEEIADALESIS